MGRVIVIDSADKRQLDRIEKAIKRIEKGIQLMSAEIDRLFAVVTKNTEVTNSIVALVNGLAAQIRANADDPEKLRQLADEIDASSNAAGAAVVANTDLLKP